MKSSPLLRKTAFMVPRFSRALFGLAITAFISLILGSATCVAIDDNATKQIWKWKYGVTDAQVADNAWLNQDADGDGIKNKDEIAAGTNPFNAGSVVKITSITNGGTTVDIIFPTENGKQYAVQATAALTTAFTSTGQVWNGTGAPKTLTVTKNGNKFFRILVQDIDTDGDGISDWAELALGLNPNIAETNLGASGTMGTLAYINQQIALPNVVTIAAATPFASEDGPTAGKFTVTRTQTLFPITVNYGVTGTAQPGTDYASLGTSVTFPALGATSQDIFVNPTVQAPTIKGGRSVTATLQAAGGGGVPPFTLGANTSATVIINSSTAPTGTGLLARYYDTASATYLDAANFGQAGMYTFARSASPMTNGTIVVTYAGSTISGLVAKNGSVPGSQVKVSFTTGSLNSSTYSNFSYEVTALTPNSFTLSITNATSFGGVTATNGNCNFSIQSFTHPATVTRVDPTVNFDWQYGTPNGVVIAPNNSSDNYSSTWEAYLHPTTTGNYIFQLDADDKARVLIDLNNNGTFDLPGEQVLEHNWTTPGADPVGTFKQSASIPLAVPATPAQRYKIRVEHVETTGDARCRLQWRVPGTTTFANIPQANQFTHTQAMTYSYTATTGKAVITPSGGHTFAVNDSVTLAFSTGVLFTPGVSSTYNKAYTISAVSGTTTYTVDIAGFPVPVNGAATTAGSPNILVPSTTGLAVGMAVSGTGLPAGEFITAIIPSANGPGLISVTTGTGVTAQASTNLTVVLPPTVPPTGTPTGSGFVLNNSTSTTTGLYNLIYPNTGFTGSPGRVGIDAAVTTGNNGLWNSGSPDATLIQPDTFSARWTGQVQPQFSETYTFTVTADDGCALWINGQSQDLKMVPSANTSGATYSYNSVSGDVTVNYPSLIVKPGSFAVGEIVRIDPSSGNLSHATGSTYTYDGVTGIATINYSNLTNVLANGFKAGDTIELDPTGGTLSPLSTLPYVILEEPAPTATTFSVDFGTVGTVGVYDSETDSTSTISILDTRNATVTKLFAAGSTYTYTSNTGVAVITYSGLTGVAQGSFANGATVELAPTAGTLVSVPSASYVISNATATTFQVTFPTGLGNQATAAAINIAAPANGVIPDSATNAFAVQISSGTYSTGVGNMNIDIANKPLKDWSSNGNERYVRIPMLAGVRYDIQLEHWENTGAAKCQLSWYSPSQPKQIIPADRLYPSSGPLAPAAHITSTDATALVGGGFSLALSGSNGAGVTLSGKPEWLSFTNGVLGGTPPAGTAGDYQILVTTTNAAGTSTSLVNLRVDANSGTVARQYWNGAYASLADIPVGTTPAGSANLTTLEAPTNFGDNYGARIRGYITAPTTGNYYFWIAGNDSAELWISNDNEPVNAFKRAWVTAGSTTPRTWNVEANQKSPWLALEQGKKYYFEILHRAGVGVGDNLAVGWAKPGEALTAPSEVVPGYALSTYLPPAPGSTPGTLYVSTMLSQNGATTTGVGNSILRLSEDETYATMTRTYSGLTGPITSEHIHVDPYLSHPSAIVFDIDQPDAAQVNAGGGPQPDGSFKWVIIDMPGVGFTAAEIREIIKQGKAYINLHTTMYPNGEIRGNYTLAEGSRTFTPPPAPPAWSDDAGLAGSAGDAARARFLTQATFGPNIADMTALKNLGSYDAWIEAQFNLSPSLTSLQLPEVIRTENASAQGGAFDSTLTFNAWWRDSIAGQDQLRQRIAFALSEIHVVSAQGPLENNALATSYFYDKLADNAFGNFRDILKDTTLTPSMGRYLDMLNNDKPDQSVGRIPNENYAREIKQLFSVGLYRMWPDGTLMLTSKDEPIDTYTQVEIVGLSHVFTGWTAGYDGPYRTSLNATSNWTRQMREVPARHYTGPKRTLNNEVLPGLTSLGTQALDPFATHTFNNYKDPAYEALPAQELEKAHDLLFNHPNVGPFICRQLIQRLVTSNPSRDYLYRVVQKFNDNGSGVRGDMKAVIKGILLDYEARSPALLNIPAYGKLREPIMRVAAAARAFRPDAWTGTYSQGTTPVSTARNITVTLPVGQSHKLVGGNNVFLNFTSGDPAPWIGSYAVLSTPAPTANTFAVLAPGWITGTYSQLAGSSVMTITMSSHWLQAGQKAFFVFTSGTAVGLAGLDNQANIAVTSNCTDNPNAVAGTTFTITSPDTTARSGNVMIPRFSPGSYTITASGLAAPNDRRVTMDTNTNHELNVGDQVQINFYDGNPLPADRVATVESVVDLNTWTFLAPSAGTNLGTNQGLNQVYQFPLKALPLARSGNVGSRPSTFALGNTTGELEQAPINSPTVFNFFLPDFKYPGALASQGITTPEFQITAETTAIRQANYLYNGVFNPTSATSVLSSFNSGNNSLVMDLSPWVTGNASDLGLGAPVNPDVPWTHNQNIPTLIDQLSTLLSASQLSANTKTVIQNFVARPIASIAPGTVPASSPCVVTTVGNHGYNTGDSVVISGVIGGTFSSSLGSTTAARTITVTGPATFTVTGVTCTVAPDSVASAHVSPVTYNMGTPTPGNDNRRDRLRGIIHLILTSPDFTIQR
jgi:uncharacterized protein (DUF1800 family)